jgi:hypothetical protein
VHHRVRRRPGGRHGPTGVGPRPAKSGRTAGRPAPRTRGRSCFLSRLACLGSVWGDNVPLWRIVRSLIHEWANVSA